MRLYLRIAVVALISCTRVDAFSTSLQQRHRHVTRLAAISTRRARPNFTATTTTIKNNHEITPIPTTWPQAWQVFLLGEHNSPRLVVASWVYLLYTRFALTQPILFLDATAFFSAIIFWWFQEYVLHRYLLHSKFDWIGKQIHESHHDDLPYHHVSIEPAVIVMTWLVAVHCFLRAILPWHFAISASLGYILAGFGYMFWHFAVHTKIHASPKSFFAKVKAHHARHHQVDDKYWFSFCLISIDDLFKTNPSVKEARRRQDLAQ